jgi:hypothetical protein
VEKQVTVNDVSKGFALATPYARQPTRNAPSKKPFMKSLTNFGEELAVGIVKRGRSRPMNCRMGNQGKADCSRMIDCLDDVGRLV